MRDIFKVGIVVCIILFFIWFFSISNFPQSLGGDCRGLPTTVCGFHNVTPQLINTGYLPNGTFITELTNQLTDEINFKELSLTGHGGECIKVLDKNLTYNESYILQFSGCPPMNSGNIYEFDAQMKYEIEGIKYVESGSFKGLVE